MRIGLGGEAAAETNVQRVVTQRVKHRLVVGGVDDDGNPVVVLRCSTDHRRAADIDILDGVVERGVLAPDSLFKGVEIDGEQIDGLDAVLLHDLFVDSAPA